MARGAFTPVLRGPDESVRRLCPRPHLALALRARQGEHFSIIPAGDHVHTQSRRLVLFGALDFWAFTYLALILSR